MAKKKVVKQIKLQIAGGKATPAQPIGPALGSAGVNIMGFCKEFNAKTQGITDVLPVIITVYQDKSFTFVTKQPPMVELIKKELGLSKGSSIPNRDKLGKLTKDQIKNIIKKKKDDLRLKLDPESEEESAFKAAANIVAGTARSMGVDVDL